MVNKQRIISTFCNLIEIDAVSFNETPVADYIQPIFTTLGCSVIRQGYDKSFNLIAYKKGTVKIQPLLLSAHMDTVSTTKDISYTITNDRITSSGNTILGADDRSAIAQIIEALMIIDECNLPHPDLEIVMTSAEEIGLIGVKNLDFSLLKSKRGIVLDCSGNIGSIVTSAPTHIVYEMNITGRAAHAGLEPEKGLNAIKVSAKIIDALPDGRIDMQSTANIGKIIGGTATNVVPDNVKIVGEYRCHDEQSLEKLKKEIFVTSQHIASRYSAKIDISESLQYKAFKVSEDNYFLKQVDDKIRLLGINPVHILTNGGSDASIFNEHDIITLNLSNGMQSVHTNSEFILIDDLVKGAELLVKIIVG